MYFNHFTGFAAVEGYPERLSYQPGEEVVFHCSARCPRYNVEIARVGKRREVVWKRFGLPGQDQLIPPRAYATGCNWEPSFRLTIPTTWRSGYYEVTLQGEGVTGDTALSQAFFVVRSAQPGRDASMVLVLSTNTYNAYNQWGGECLYTGVSHASFARPIQRGFLVRPTDGDGFDGRNANITPGPDAEHHQLITYLQQHPVAIWCSSGGWFNWERRFVVWAENNGYTLDFAINSDLEFHPEVLNGYKLMLSVGHDEYWTWAMRDTVDAFVEGGGNVAFFSGNLCYWQVRYEDEGRTMVCHKYTARTDDPVMGTDRQHLLSGIWSDPLVGRPENLTTGLSFCRGGYIRFGKGVQRASGAYTVYRPDHWVFAKTDLQYGDVLGLGSYIAAYEVDGCALTLVNGLPVPTHSDGTPDDFTILAMTPARLLSNLPENREIRTILAYEIEGLGDLEYTATILFGDTAPENVAQVAYNHAVMGTFRRGKGTVFNAGTTDWAYGLDADPLVQQVTRNVLDRLSS